MAKILIIDDTKNIRKMVAMALTQSGHEVKDAENGQLGLQLFGDGAGWDLTLVDQQMPEMAGDEFIVAARKRDPLARIVMMTAFATPELAAQVIQSGALDFLRKPFGIDVLRAAVEVALSHPRQSAQAAGTGEGEAEAEFDPNIALPQPGEAGYAMPRISWRMNGFSFWPLPASQTGAHPQGFELGRLFQVREPQNVFTSCFMGITPHIRQQIEREVEHEIAADDPFWDKLCGQTLLRFLSDKAQTPPDVLPVYEVPAGMSAGASASTRRTGRGGLVTWGGFFGE